MRGVFSAKDVRAALREEHSFVPSTVLSVTKLVAVKNTHNIGGGKVWSLEQLEEMTGAARARRLERRSASLSRDG